MKKLIYVGLIALLGVNFGCQKEDLNNESPELDNRIKLDSNFQKTGFGDQNGNVEETYHLYLDMSYIESAYTGSYTGSFSQHYYNEMSSHFTIYSVEYAAPSCGNIERWTVNKAEFDAYVAVNGPLVGYIVIDNSSDDGSTSSNSSNNSDNTGWGDDQGNVENKKKPTHNDDEPNSTGVPIQYEGCF